LAHASQAAAQSAQARMQSSSCCSISPLEVVSVVVMQITSLFEGNVLAAAAGWVLRRAHGRMLQVTRR
jgi:hypothetical protein